MGWSSMGMLGSGPVRSRGESVMPEPETNERMKELVKGTKGGMEKVVLKSKTNLEAKVPRK